MCRGLAVLFVCESSLDKEFSSQQYILLVCLQVEASVLSIVYTRQKVFVSMENGRMMAFHRDKDDIWDFENFDMIEVSVVANLKTTCYCFAG